jgi:hypothetical protein
LLLLLLLLLLLQGLHSIALILAMMGAKNGAAPRNPLMRVRVDT